MNNVPATTAIRRNRVANIDTDRLLRRRDHLIDTLLVQGGRTTPGGRMNFGFRAAELHAIRRELVARGAVSADDDAAAVRAAQDVNAFA